MTYCLSPSAEKEIMSPQTDAMIAAAVQWAEQITLRSRSGQTHFLRAGPTVVAHFKQR
jgi:malonyl CoA-acyl carrier protein transacylase